MHIDPDDIGWWTLYFSIFALIVSVVIFWLHVCDRRTGRKISEFERHIRVVHDSTDPVERRAALDRALKVME